MLVDWECSFSNSCHVSSVENIFFYLSRTPGTNPRLKDVSYVTTKLSRSPTLSFPKDKEDGSQDFLEEIGMIAAMSPKVYRSYPTKLSPDLGR